MSGNPSGRPSGSRNQRTLFFEQILEDDGEDLIRKAIQLSKKGNVLALRLCLERLLPPRKDRTIDLELRPTPTAQDLPLQYQDIIRAVAEGRISPAEGESLAAILSHHTHALETAEYDRRMLELESALAEVREFAKREREFLGNTQHEIRAKGLHRQ
jgi:hypothetical protein